MKGYSKRRREARNHNEIHKTYTKDTLDDTYFKNAVRNIHKELLSIPMTSPDF